VVFSKNERKGYTKKQTYGKKNSHSETYGERNSGGRDKIGESEMKRSEKFFGISLFILFFIFFWSHISNLMEAFLIGIYILLNGGLLCIIEILEEREDEE